MRLPVPSPTSTQNHHQVSTDIFAERLVTVATVTACDGQGCVSYCFDARAAACWGLTAAVLYVYDCRSDSETAQTLHNSSRAIDFARSAARTTLATLERVLPSRLVTEKNKNDTPAYGTYAVHRLLLSCGGSNSKTYTYEYMELESKPCLSVLPNPPAKKRSRQHTRLAAYCILNYYGSPRKHTRASYELQHILLLLLLLYTAIYPTRYQV